MSSIYTFYSYLNFPQNWEKLPYRFLHQFQYGERHSLHQLVVNPNQNELPKTIKSSLYSSLQPMQKFLDSPLHMFVCIPLQPTLLYIVQGIYQCRKKLNFLFISWKYTTNEIYIQQWKRKNKEKKK